MENFYVAYGYNLNKITLFGIIHVRIQGSAVMRKILVTYFVLALEPMFASFFLSLTSNN